MAGIIKKNFLKETFLYRITKFENYLLKIPAQSNASFFHTTISKFFKFEIIYLFAMLADWL